jgi:hypothetical protein
VIFCPKPWPLPPRIHDQDIHPVGGECRFPGTKEISELRSELRRGYFICVEVKHPLIAAMVFCKPLLLAKTNPFVVEDFGTCALGHCDGVVTTVGLDNNDFVDPVDHGRDTAGDPMGLILGNNEARNRKLPGDC